MELHDQPVRASACISTDFTLPMASSPDFGSYTYDNMRAINTWFPYDSILLGFSLPYK